MGSLFFFTRQVDPSPPTQHSARDDVLTSVTTNTPRSVTDVLTQNCHRSPAT